MAHQPDGVAHLPPSDDFVLRWPVQCDLVRATRASAASISDRVTSHYLTFRQEYYQEAHPSLADPPPKQAPIRQAHSAQLAEHALQLLPGAIKAIPIMGGLLNHLQQVANLHSITERERTDLHNTTMFCLHGINGGIHPWYLEWMLASAQRINAQFDPRYFLAHPWDALLYQSPVELTVFEAVVRDGEIHGAERIIERFAERLIQALADPIHAQPKLAFTGPDADAREARFNGVTAAALAFAAFLVIGEARVLFHPDYGDQGPAPSLLAPLPPEMQTLLK